MPEAASVHRRDKLETVRKIHVVIRARVYMTKGLDRLRENTIVCEGYLTPTNAGRDAGSRRPPPGHLAAVEARRCGSCSPLGFFRRLRRQQARHALRQHRFAGAGWADHQHGGRRPPPEIEIGRQSAMAPGLGGESTWLPLK